MNRETVIKEVKTSNFTSTTFDQGTQNLTDSLLPSSVVIKAGDTPVGAIQHFSIEEKYDGITGSCSRVYFNKQSIMQAFTGKHHVARYDVPETFEINVCFAHGPITTLKGVKITSYNRTFTVSAFVVTEHITFTAESIATVDQGYQLGQKPAEKPAEESAETTSYKNTSYSGDTIIKTDLRELIEDLIDYCVDHPGNLLSKDYPSMLRIGFEHEDGTYWAIHLHNCKKTLDSITETNSPFKALIQKSFATSQGRVDLCTAIVDEAKRRREGGEIKGNHDVSRKE